MVGDARLGGASRTRDRLRVVTAWRLAKRASVIVLLLASHTASAADGAVIERFHTALIVAMKSDGGFTERAAIVAPAVSSTFDFQTIARVSLGKTWREIDGDARSSFIALLEELIVATYADRFSSFNNQRFETVSIDDSKADRGVVKTRLVRVDDEPVTLDYYLRGGLVYNIVAEGVSDLSLRRADYAAILRAKGFEGLVADVRQKIAAYRAGGDAQ